MGVPLVTASGCIKGGRLCIHNRPAFDEAVRGLRDGWEVEIEIGRLRATRSVQANRYYFGVVLAEIARHTGHDVDTLHELLKVRHLSRTEVVIDAHGNIVDKVILGRSTRQLNISEFAEYVDAIRLWAAEKLCMEIPDSDPTWRQSMEEPGYGAGV